MKDCKCEGRCCGPSGVGLLYLFSCLYLAHRHMGGQNRAIIFNIKMVDRFLLSLVKVIPTKIRLGVKLSRWKVIVCQREMRFGVEGHWIALLNIKHRYLFYYAIRWRHGHVDTDVLSLFEVISKHIML